MQLRDYDVLTAQEQLVSVLISSAASNYGLEIAGRSKFARQAPTDFVVLRLFNCNLKVSRGGLAMQQTQQWTTICALDLKA